MKRAILILILVVASLSSVRADVAGPPACNPQPTPDIELSLDGPTSVYIGQSITITASTYDLDSCTGSGPGLVDSVDRFNWYIDDEEYVPGRGLDRITLSFATAGMRTIKVITDDAPLYADDPPATAYYLVAVEHAPEPPIHAAMGIATSENGPWKVGTVDVKAGDPVYFTGDDPDDPTTDKDVNQIGETVADPIASYAWDFGDGSQDSGAHTSHTYSSAGSYQVNMTADDAHTVVDDAAATASSSVIRVFTGLPAAPMVTTPVADVPNAGLMPTVLWSGEPHDQFEVRIGLVVDAEQDDDPDAPTVWSSDPVESEDSQIACSATLEEGKQYYVFVREHNVWGWGPWSATRHRFTVRDDNQLPENVSFTPDSGSFSTGTSVSFVATYSDHAGYGNIRRAEVLIDESSLDGVDACRLLYDPQDNLCWLATSDNTDLVGGFAPGSNEIMENDQVKVHLDQTSVSPDDTQLAVTWCLEFKAPFAGDKNVAMSVTNERGQIDPENPQVMGSISVVAPGPNARISSPANGAYLNTSTVTMSGTATDETGVGRVEVSIDGGQNWADADGTTSWTYTWSGAADGAYAIKTRATNTASPAQVEIPGTGIQVTIDTQAPRSTITSPSDGAVVVGTTIEVQGTAADRFGVAKVDLSFDGGSTWVPAAGTGVFSYSFPVTQSGSYVIKSRATDLAGNVEAPGSGISVAVDYRDDPQAMTANGTSPQDTNTNSLLPASQVCIDLAPYTRTCLVDGSITTGIPITGWQSPGMASIGFSMLYSNPRSVFYYEDVLCTGWWRNSYDLYIQTYDCHFTRSTEEFLTLCRPDGSQNQRVHWRYTGSLEPGICLHGDGDDTDDWFRISDATHSCLGYRVETKDKIEYFYTQPVGKNKWYLKSIQYPDGNEISLLYDAASRLSSVTDGGRGVDLTWGYQRLTGRWEITKVTSPGPYGSTIDTDLTYQAVSGANGVCRTVTVTYPESTSSDTPYALELSRFSSDPPYPTNNTPFYNYGSKWVEVGFDAARRVKRIAVPAASSILGRNEWGIAYLRGGKYTSTDPSNRITTICLRDESIDSTQQWMDFGNQCKTATVTDPRGNETRYKHVSWTGWDGDFCTRRSGLDIYFKKGPGFYGRDYWPGFRIFDIARKTVGPDGKSDWAVLSSYNWNGTRKTNSKTNSLSSERNTRNGFIDWVKQGPRFAGDLSDYTSTYKWDASGNLLEVTNPNEETTTTTYTTENLPQRVTTPEGHTTKYFYWPGTRLVKQIVADYGFATQGHQNITTDYTYDDHNNLASVAGPYYVSDGPGSAPVTNYTCDDRYHAYVTKTDVPGSNKGRLTSTAGYGPLGHQFWQTTPIASNAHGFGLTLTDHDKLGRPYYAWTSAYPVSTVSMTQYYANDKVEKSTDPEGNITQFEYDPCGNLLQTRRQENVDEHGMVHWIVTDYTYGDPNGLLTKVEVSEEDNSDPPVVTQAKKTVVTYTYDEWSRQDSVTTFAGDQINGPDTVHFQYNRDGSLYRKTDACGNITQMTYDPAGRLATREYIKAGQSAVDSSLTVTFQYDHDGRLRFVWDCTFAGAPAEEYTYYGSGMVKQEINRYTGRTISYAYTASGKPASVSITDLQNSPPATYSYTYWPNDALKTVTSPSGDVTYFDYDERGRLSEKRTARGKATVCKSDYIYQDGPAPCGALDARNFVASIRNWDASQNRYTADGFSYDKVGDLKSQSESTIANEIPITTVTNYNYDKLYQLKSEDRNGRVDYTYDARGNRKSKGSTTYTYDSGNRLSSSTDGYTYQYDDDGNLKKRLSGNTVVASYDYDIDGNLTKVTLNPDDFLHKRVISFTYSSSGERVGRTDGSDTTKYVYVGNDLVQEIESDGTLKISYNPGIGQTVGADISRGSTSFFLGDHLGSTVGIVPDGSTWNDLSYDAWGNQLYHLGTTNTAFGFAGAKGYYTDEGTGLMKLGCRYYDPTLGRFITKDPDHDGWNWYAYCGNNPVNAVDPTGNTANATSPMSNTEYEERVNGYQDLSALSLSCPGEFASSGGSVEEVRPAAAGGQLSFQYEPYGFKQLELQYAEGELPQVTQNRLFGLGFEKSGMEAGGFVKNTLTLKGMANGSETSFIADVLDKNLFSELMVEYKGVKYQSWTAQLQAETDHCIKNDIDYMLMVRPDTKLTTPCFEEISKMGAIKTWDPPTGSISSYVHWLSP